MISVIIATYNAELNLQRTLDSLKTQINKNFELIVVDGDSKDNTMRIIKSNKDIINIYLSEPDTGLYDAWNKGIRISSGEWICFLGAGDTLVPEAFEKYFEFLFNLQGKYDYISARINRIDDSGLFLSNMGKAWNWPHFKKIMTVAHVGSLHSRILFDEVGFFNVDYNICADYELLLRKRSKLRCAFLNYTIGNMPIGGTSFSIDALKQSAKAKYYTGKQSLLKVFLSFNIQLILFEMFKIRHRINN